MLKFAALRSAELARWIEDRVTFPSTMVDRIVPATTPEDIDSVSEALGARDPAAVVGEPFRQWVIEDKFAGERPPLDLAGAQFVADAKPYEQIKMRVLNAAQSTLAHQGALVGHEFSYRGRRRSRAGRAHAQDARAGNRDHAAEGRGHGGRALHRSLDGAHPQHRDPPSMPSDRHGRIAEDRPASRRSVARAACGGPAGAACSRSRSPAGSPMCLSGARRFGARWAPSDPWAESVIAIGEKNADWTELARAVLSIVPIFGVDMARPQVVEARSRGASARSARRRRRAAISENGSTMNSRRTIARADAVADAGVGAALGYSRPGSYEELRAVLSSGTARLPKKLRQVAIHLWQHPTAVALGTVTSVAREAGVQPSTLVRFAQAFGYSGFSDLQEVFKAHLAGGGQSRDSLGKRFEQRGGAPRRRVHRLVAPPRSPRPRSARPRPIRDDERDAGGGGSDLHHRLEARFLAGELCVARARQSRRAQSRARQRRLDRLRASALRGDVRRGARRSASRPTIPSPRNWRRRPRSAAFPSSR